MIAIIEPYLTTTPNPEDVAAFCAWYAPRPEITLVDWLADMRRAHAVQCDHHARRVHSSA